MSELSFRAQATLLLFSGVLAALALPPFGALILLPATMPQLLVAAQSTRRPRQAFALGWFWGFGHFLAGLYWIGNSLLVEADKFAWLLPFAIALIPAALACYTGLFAVVARRLMLPPLLLVPASACLWVLVEYLRGILFTGFPWNLLGYSWSRLEGVLQFASLFGIYGLSFLAACLGFLPLALRAQRTGLAAFLTSLLLLSAISMWGNDRLKHAPGNADEDAIEVRVVQGNIEQFFKWDEKVRIQSFQKYLDMTASGDFLKGEGRRLIVWPETAVTFVLAEEPQLIGMIRHLLPPESVLLTGALRITKPDQPFEVWNDVYALSQKGIEGNYDKVHLVPFGEFVPLRWLIPFVEKITHGNGDFSSGAKGQSITLPGEFPIAAPLVCYEAIFPDGAIPREPRPGVIVNVTNDAWFGKSSGPYQHLAMVRVRAVEQGLPLLRAANTGISAVIDSYGRRLKTLPLGATGVIDLPLPPAAPPTLFSRTGSMPILMLCLLGLLAALVKAHFGPRNKP